jgi:hypothetical protein
VAKDVVRVVFRVDPSSPAPSEPRQSLPHCPTRRHSPPHLGGWDHVPLGPGGRGGVEPRGGAVWSRARSVLVP